MKKFAAVSLIVLSGLSMTGCGANEAGRVAGDTEGFSRETIVVGGELFDCIFEHYETQWGTMSCEAFANGDARGQSDTEGFEREVITIGGDKFDCIFNHRGHKWGTMSCDPLQK